MKESGWSQQTCNYTSAPQITLLNPSLHKQEEQREHCSDMCTFKLAVRTHPDQVHFLTVLHEVPNFGPHLLPHPSEVPQHTELLEGLVNL